MKKILSLCAVIGLFSLIALADVRPPETPKPKPTPKQAKSIDSFFSIRLDKNAKEAKLIIPKDQLKQLRAQIDELDDNSDNTAAVSFTKTQTIISGMFMTLAFVFGGVWLARSRKIDTKASKILVVGSVLFLSGAVATIAFANAGPPPELRQITSKLFDKKVFDGWNSAGGKIKVQVSESSNVIELTVPDMPEQKKTGGEE